jgi:hypothetical protein
MDSINIDEKDFKRIKGVISFENQFAEFDNVNLELGMKTINVSGLRSTITAVSI